MCKEKGAGVGGLYKKEGGLVGVGKEWEEGGGKS